MLFGMETINHIIIIFQINCKLEIDALNFDWIPLIIPEIAGGWDPLPVIRFFKSQLITPHLPWNRLATKESYSAN